MELQKSTTHSIHLAYSWLKARFLSRLSGRRPQAERVQGFRIRWGPQQLDWLTFCRQVMPEKELPGCRGCGTGTIGPCREGCAFHGTSNRCSTIGKRFQSIG